MPSNAEALVLSAKALVSRPFTVDVVVLLGTVMVTISCTLEDAIATLT